MDALLEQLAHGTTLCKVKSSTRLLDRKFFLDLKNMIMYYEGSKKKNKDTSLRISKIREVREGENDFSKKIQNREKSQIFVIVLGASHKVLYMFAPNTELRNKWVRGLRYAMQQEQLAVQQNESDRSIREAFNLADKNGDGHLDFEEVMKLLKALNADIKRKYAREMFDAADKNKNIGQGRASVLDREEFVDFYHRLTKRVEIEEVFLKYAYGKGFMTIKDLLGFLQDGQKKTDANEETCRNILDQFEPDGPSKKKEQLTLLGFRRFITSEREHIFNPAHRIVYQDMTQPMTHYFIASSHNTYLAEDQLRGPSKVEMYIRALQKGCRCVELDCWDGPDGEPVIYHGHTLTSKIAFHDVIKAINIYAFEASPYPVTLSLENHCSIEQQKVMADMMTSVFGDKIWCPQKDVISTPCPEDLREKIILKGKKLPQSTVDTEDVSDEDEAADIPSDEINDNNNRKSSNSSSHKKIKLYPGLSKITAMQSVGFKTVENPAQADNFFSVVSLGESKVEKEMQSNPERLNTITHNTLIRTYPSGTRTDSSNYNPIPMWNHGCQVVALNYQTSGEAMQINHGRFMDNGGSGYILKPPFLLSEDKFHVVKGNVARTRSKNLRITIISGYQIPKPNESSKGEVIDPFVKIEMYGVPSDMAEYKTKKIENNGFNPRWYDTFKFTIRVPELAVIRFTVKDEDRGRDDFIGYYSLPVLSMQEGFRHFPLFDKYGTRYSESLLFTYISLTSNEHTNHK